MALTVDEIAEIINTMREENENNVQSVEKVLTEINNKLEMMAEDSEATDLIRVYISELKKSVDEKHTITVEKFNEIEKSFNNLSAENEQLAKTSELRDLFNALVNNITNFSNNISSQKNILNTLDGKLENLSENIYSKDEMASLISEISLNISNVNDGFEKAFKNLEEKLAETDSAINSLDNSSKFSDLKNIVENISSQVDALPSSISQYQKVFESLKEIISDQSSQSLGELKEKFESLENSFETIVTGSDFKGFKQDLADFVQKIIDNSSALNAELSYSTERIENILTTVKSLDFRDDFENVVGRINEIKETFEEGSRQNYSNLSSEIANIVKDVDNSFQNLDEKRQEVYSSLKEKLDSIIENLLNVVNNNSQDKLDEIYNRIVNVSNDVLSLRNGVSSDLQDHYGDLKAGLGNVINDIRGLRDEFVIKNSEVLSLASNRVGQLEEKLTEQIKELSGLRSLVAESNNVEPAQLSEGLEKVSNDLSMLLSDAKDNANSNYEAVKGYIEEVSQTVNNLQNEFVKTAEQNADNIITGITDISSVIDAFRDEFKQSAMSGLENSSKILDSIGEISDKMDSVEQNLSDKAKGNFENLKSILDELSQKVTDDIQRQQDVFVQSNFVGEQQKLETLKNLSDDVKAIETALSSDIEAFKYSVQDNISGIRDYIAEINDSLSSSQHDSEAKLSTKLETIETLTHTFEASVASVYEEVKNVLEKINILDFTEQSNEIKVELSNIVSTSNFILSSINDIVTKNSEITVLFSNLSSISASKEDAVKILEKLENLEKQDYSYDLAQISSKIDDVSAAFETSASNNYEGICEKIDEINENISKSDVTNIVSQKINDFEMIISSLKDIIANTSDENKVVLNDKLEKFEQMFSKVITGEDFEEFKKEFSEFIEKILDNSNVLHFNSETNREHIEDILEKINSLDYSSDFEIIAGRIDEIQSSFENNSKMNYENIINEIDNLKNQLSEDLKNRDNSSAETFEKFNLELSNLTEHINALNDSSSKNSLETIDRVSGELHLIVDEIKNSIENNVKLNSEDIKLSISDIISEINILKDEFVKRNDANTFNITFGIDNVKSTLDNLLSLFTSANEELKNSQAENSQNILDVITNISSSVENLKNDMQQVSENYVDRVYDAVNQAAEKIDALSENLSGDIANNLNSLKGLLEKFGNELRVYNDELAQKTKENNDAQLAEIKTISGNILSFKDQVNEAVESLKLYISELDENANNSQNVFDSKLTEKLLDMEAELSHISEEYEQKMEMLQGKLSEFVQIVENSTSDTEAKIASSLEEITDVKTEISALSNALKSSKISSDEKFTETLSVIDAGIENIINNIKTSESSLVENFDGLIKDSFVPVEEQFSNLLQAVETLKQDDLFEENKALISDLEEKISDLKQEIGLVSTDISDALQHKSEEILRAFDPLKTGLESLQGLDFGNLLGELKSQLETSFMNLSLDVNNHIATSSGAISNLEEAYQETLEKISVIENAVCGKVQDDIESLNATLEKSAGVFTHALDEKLDEYLSDLKAHLDLSSHNINEQAITEVSEKLNKIDDIKKSINEQSDILSEIDTNIKKSVQSLNKNNEEKELLKDLFAKVDNLSMSNRTNEVLNSLDVLIEKTDITNKGFVEGFKYKFENVVQAQSKASELLLALHEKVDILAMGDSESDLLDEIDDIKDLIFEQRKFFEASSDEKSAAIDKYLRDLLLKLDSIDLEKSLDGVKDTIVNALVSLFDQISFVEESEDIKDFVEEKTDAINENLLKVQTQLHQIASSSDDFDYSYTLQDVESDIAKLRLAMNQISAGTDFEGLSKDIQKIVGAVEGLETSLTQDQIVDLKGDIEKLNDDILSISSRTNKLLLTSDESYKALNDGLNNFSSLIYRLEDRVNDLDKTQVAERLERKLDSIHSMALTSANADKVFHQVMMYLGEWIDSTTENISSITDKTSEISLIKEHIDELRSIIPEKSQLLDELESRFEKQEERLDQLEIKLDKILSTLAEKDDMVLNRKVDKIEKMLSRLGSNMEKLTSYVDEE